MTRKVVMAGSAGGGKFLMNQLEWKYMRCPECDIELMPIDINDYDETKICEKCGIKHIFIKKIRPEMECYGRSIW